MDPRVTDVNNKLKPVVLLVLDGWGVAHAERQGIGLADSAPNIQYLWKNYPKAILRAQKHPIGVDRKIQSSEVGHASIGAGRTVLQDLTEISLAIESGVFFENPTIKNAFAYAKEKNKAVHLVGLLSDGGVNGDIAHAKALLQFAAREGVSKVFLHLITDGFDIPDKTAPSLLSDLEQGIKVAGVGEIATIAGRFYGLDRGGNWDRTRAFYEAMMFGKGATSETARQAILDSYRNNIGDERIAPTVITGDASKVSNKNQFHGRVNEGDVVLCWNFRPDRSQQLVRSFLDKSVFRVLGIARSIPVAQVKFITLTDYYLRLPNLEVAFPSVTLPNVLSELLANHGLKQLKVAESEKYAHITYFFNGGRDEPFANEDRIVIASQKTDNFAKTPQMRSAEITEVLEKNISSGKYDFIVANFANADLVGHTMDNIALRKAVGFIDEAVRKIANAVLKTNGVLLITADHGSLENVRRYNLGLRQVPEVIDPIPLIMVAKNSKKTEESVISDLEQLLPEAIKTQKQLQDIAPTILELMGIAKPSDMEGVSLLRELN